MSFSGNIHVPACPDVDVNDVTQTGGLTEITCLYYFIYNVLGMDEEMRDWSLSCTRLEFFFTDQPQETIRPHTYLCERSTRMCIKLGYIEIGELLNPGDTQCAPRYAINLTDKGRFVKDTILI